jgi:two-component system sensor histidine kinase DesK
VPTAYQELFGWAVREGLTNVARHSRATRCTVTLTPTSVEISDDGVGGPPVNGNGLAGLRERAASVAAVVEAGPVSPTGWRLSVSA